MNILENLQNMINQGQSGQPGGRSGASGSGMDSLFGGLGNILGGGQNSLGSALGGMLGASTGGSSGSGLSKLLTPAAVGGILAALLTSKTARNMAGGALLAGGGAMLWDKFKNRMRQEDAGSSAPLYARTPSAVAPVAPTALAERSLRLVRALVFAARCDGHVDDAESQAIREQIAKLDLGAEGDALIRKTLEEPLDPARIAQGVGSEEEALELFTLSRAVVDPDQFMEKNYLAALANALHIPDDVRDAIIKG